MTTHPRRNGSHRQKDQSCKARPVIMRSGMTAFHRAAQTARSFSSRAPGMGTSGPNTLPLNNDKQHAHQARPKGQTKPQTFFKNRMSWHGQAIVRSSRSIKPSGGARRDRTDDLMLAKHALSQLSYGPTLAAGECMFAFGNCVTALPPEGAASATARRGSCRVSQSGERRCRRLRPEQRWWAWEDSNFRPHAYQARALTN